MGTVINRPLKVGTVLGTVAAGDDNRIVNSLQQGSGPASVGLENVNNTSDTQKVATGPIADKFNALIAKTIALDISRADIAGLTITLQSFVINNGARYIAGTSTGPMAIKDASNKWWELDLSAPVIPAGWFGVVANNINKASDNGIGINAAMYFLSLRQGGILQLPPGDIYVDRTIDNKFSHVLVQGYGRPTSHDTGAPSYATRIIPTTAFTVLRHRTPTAIERGITWQNNWKNTGGGFQNLMVYGNGVAPRLFHVTSIVLGIHQVYCENAVSPGTEAILYDCIPDYRHPDSSQRQLGEAADNQLNTVDLAVRQDGGLSANLDGIHLGGVEYSGNTSLTYGMKVRSRITDGIGVRLSNADNLEFEHLLIQKVGTGNNLGVLVQAAMPGQVVGSIEVRNYSANANAKVESLADRAGATGIADIRIYHLDGNNGTPVPTGPNVTVESTDYPLWQSINKTFRGLAIGNDLIAAKNARDYLNNTGLFSLVLANTANSGVAWLNGSDVFFQRINIDTGSFEFQGPKSYAFATNVSIAGNLVVGSSLNVKATASGSFVTSGVRNDATDAGCFAAIQYSTGASTNVWQTFARNGAFVIGIAQVADYVIFNSAGSATFYRPLTLPIYTVSTLPPGSTAQTIYVSNARKIGEAAGAGTGVTAYYSNGAWRRPSDDTAVVA